MIGARRFMAARRGGQPVWRLAMQFDQPNLAAASKAGVLIVDQGGGSTLTPVAGRFGDGAAVPVVLGLDWSGADGFAAATADQTGATPWTLEFWCRSPSGGHVGWLSLPNFSYLNSASIGATWTHVAVCWDGLVGRLFVGGALVPGYGASIVAPASATLNSPNNPNPTDAQYDALRLTIGAALYTAPFTPPTSPPTP